MPITTVMGVADAKTGALGTREVTVSVDEGIRADTTLEGLSKIRPSLPGGAITAGNASQFSDGASAAVVMDGKLASARGLQPLGAFRGLPLPDVSRTKWVSGRCSPYLSCLRRPV